MASPHPPTGPFLTVVADDKVDPQAVAAAQPPPSYQLAAPAEAPPPPPPGHQCDHRRRRFRRFGHLLIAALFLWFAVHFIVRHCKLRRLAPPHPDDDFPWGPPPGRRPGPGHGGGHFPRPGDRIDSCVGSGDWVEVDPSDGRHPDGFEEWQRAELSLPSSADNIFLISRSFAAGGALHLVEGGDRDDIGVEIVAGSSKDSDLLKGTKVCTLLRKKDGHGVGIFTPPLRRHHGRDRDMLFFNITVTLPEGEDITTIPHFETHLPKYGHIIKGLEKHAFGSISLHSSNSPIFVENLVADEISIRSRNSPIIGTFNTSSSIKLKTSNSPIKVKVNAFNGDNHPATKVRIHTSNSVVYADLALLSAPESESKGSFIVHARTSNSPLALNITEQAPDSVLNLEAHTSNSPAHVHLHPSFEGTFKLRTSVFPAVVSPDEEVEDPAGLDRKRVVNVKTVGHGSGVVFGDVAWVPQDDEVPPGGKVEVVTRNSPVHLSL